MPTGGKWGRHADWAAAAADRYPFPNSRTSGLSCAFDSHRNRFHHPLGGTDTVPAPQLGFTPIQSDAFGTKVEQFGQPLLESGLRNTGPLIPAVKGQVKTGDWMERTGRFSSNSGPPSAHLAGYIRRTTVQPPQ